MTDSDFFEYLKELSNLENSENSDLSLLFNKEIISRL